VANFYAYFITDSVTKEKSFIRVTPGDISDPGTS